MIHAMIWIFSKCEKRVQSNMDGPKGWTVQRDVTRPYIWNWSEMTEIGRSAKVDGPRA